MEMGPTEVGAFLTHLAVNHRVSASTQNQALNAIVFMYRNVVGRDPGKIGAFGRAKRPNRLPTVLTQDEVKRVLVHLEGTYGLMARLLYGTGMRLMECVRTSDPWRNPERGERGHSSRRSSRGQRRPVRVQYLTSALLDVLLNAVVVHTAGSQPDHDGDDHRDEQEETFHGRVPPLSAAKRHSSAAAAALSDSELSGTGIAAAVCCSGWFGVP